MTDGTSQGLFIVVAIVIFGIFTLMAYILFEDTLSPALANMFTTATEQANAALTENRILANLNDFTLDAESSGFTLEKDLENKSLTLKSSEKKLGGVWLPMDEIITVGKRYILDFDIELLEGTVYSIGGHLAISENANVYIDGKLIERSSPEIYKNVWNTGVNLETPLKKGVPVNIRIDFVYDKPENKVYENFPIAIQPNRNWAEKDKQFKETYTVKISNPVFISFR